MILFRGGITTINISMKKTRELQSESLKGTRLLSVDFFRGLTMFLLIAEFTDLYNILISPAYESSIIYTIGNQLHHHSWNGLHFWDLIQPFFMFIVGVAMPFSFQVRQRKGESYRKILLHTIKRAVILLILGWALNCIAHKEIVFFFQNVLSQLSVAIIISFLLMRKNTVTLIAVSLSLLIFAEIVYRSFPINGFNQPFSPDHNFGSWLDMIISGRLSAGHWVSFNAIPTTAHTIWGVLSGKLLMSNKSNVQKLTLLVSAGLFLIIAGYGLNPVTPIIKRIATSSFVIASGGFSLMGLAISFWLIDMMKVRKGIKFFTIVGMNPLFIYLFAFVGGAEMIVKIVQSFTTSLLKSLQIDPKLITASIALFLLWYICYWMYQRNILIKI